ncbi:MAG: hypothetical protein H0W84_00075 [Bacteroidetes bacterium]|nr:hypothetical protein [Bacteroidota bacterium]
MKYSFYILFFLVLTQAVMATSVERKIIIENNQFYFTTIDEQFQIATLHTGKISQPLDSAKLFALPAGRNYDYPINPFSWDLYKGTFYGINFLTHPMNSRNAALKRFPLSSLEVWNDKITALDMIMKSIDQNTFTRNDPYQYVSSKSNVLNHFFYDGIAMNDTSYFMAICNNNEISIWNYNEKKWVQGIDQKFPFNNYFSLFKMNKKLYLVTSEGSIFSVENYRLTLVKNKSLGDKLANYIMIENRDNKTFSIMKSSQLNFAQPLDKQIVKNAVKLF